MTDGSGQASEPLYEKVKSYVLARMGEANWATDRRLPSEHELVAALGVSRMTVNRALRELTAEGHLVRIQGVGTFIAPPKPQGALIEINDIAGEIAKRGNRHVATVFLLELIEEPDTALLAQFELAASRPLFHSIVLHGEDGRPALLEERYVDAELAPDYGRQDFSKITTYDYLSSRVPLTEVEHVISAVAADADMARQLDVAPGEPCLLLHRRTWWNRRVVTVNRFTYAGERYALGSRYQPEAVKSLA
jgi:GntR family histidine utilization transcriptional repressor